MGVGHVVKLENDIHEKDPTEMVERTTSLIEHLHREDHFDDDAHQKNIDSLEQEFHMNNFGPARSQHLSARPPGLHSATPGSCPWSAYETSPKAAEEDAHRFKAEFEGDVQFIFSHTQHH